MHGTNMLWGYFNVCIYFLQIGIHLLKENSKCSQHKGNINTTWVTVSPTLVAIEQMTGYRKHCWTTSGNPQSNGRMPLPSIIFFKILIQILILLANISIITTNNSWNNNSILALFKDRFFQYPNFLALIIYPDWCFLKNKIKVKI